MNMSKITRQDSISQIRYQLDHDELSDSLFGKHVITEYTEGNLTARSHISDCSSMTSFTSVSTMEETDLILSPNNEGKFTYKTTVVNKQIDYNLFMKNKYVSPEIDRIIHSEKKRKKKNHTLKKVKSVFKSCAKLFNLFDKKRRDRIFKKKIKKVIQTRMVY